MRFMNKVRDWKVGNFMRDALQAPGPSELADINRIIMERIDTSESSLCLVEVTIDVRYVHQFPIGIKVPDKAEKEPQ